MNTPTKFQSMLQRAQTARKETQTSRETEESGKKEGTGAARSELEKSNHSLLQRVNDAFIKVLNENPDFERVLSTNLEEPYGNVCLDWNTSVGIYIVTQNRMRKMLGPTPPPQKFYIAVASTSCDRSVGFTMYRVMDFGEKIAQSLESMIADPDVIMFRAAKVLYL